jgi:DMSO/TMAO reductase YedYZ molybdopterin-dependent catalytic subunit
MAPDWSSMNRRRFLAVSGSIAGAVFSPLGRLAAAQPPIAGGRLVRTLPLGDPLRADNPPLDRLLGDGLDARLFTDLSHLSPGRLITASDRFFVRTACPDAVEALRPWTIELGGRIRDAATLALDALLRLAVPVGTHLLECAGNTNPNNFGLISSAEWHGVPIGAMLDRVTQLDAASRILITGVDDEPRPSRTSIPGASWIFSRDELERAGAFLATHMNGAPLPRHHGAPVRLVVPGWYACTCIKWVSRIDWVDGDAEPTSQMLEFAARTHQPAGVRLAREFAPAEIDVAAMPIRIEQWQADRRPVYRVIGIVWGGSTRADALQIRFRTGDEWMDISDYDPPKTTATWSLWSHQWRPAEAGRYHPVVRAKDPGVRTRRLDLFFYVRAVDITDV